MPNLPAPRPDHGPHPIRWLKARSRSSERNEPTGAELAEGVWPRARRDAKKGATGTISGVVVLLIGTTAGVHLAGKDHAPGQSPTALVEIGFPVLGLLIGAAFILLVRLLLTFRAQRNEVRRALARANSSLSEAARGAPSMKTPEWEITGTSSESTGDLLQAVRAAGLLVPKPTPPRQIKDDPTHSPESGA
jgi:hypothetical protein